MLTWPASSGSTTPAAGPLGSANPMFSTPVARAGNGRPSKFMQLTPPRSLTVPRRIALISVLSLAALASRRYFKSSPAAPIDMQSLEQSKIIPDLIDRVSAASAAHLDVSFHGKPVHNGMTITPENASTAPKAAIKGGSEGGLYTLIASDPDPPDPANPIKKEWLHWLVTNIPAGSDASKGHEVTSWMGPAPPVGVHRYVFMLFQQPNQEPLQVIDPSGGKMMGRAHFNTRNFAKHNSLGDPVAVAWFNSHK